MVYVSRPAAAAFLRPVLVALFVVSSKNIFRKGYAAYDFCSIIFS